MFDQLHVLPADWQAGSGRVSPGDLSKFAPEGFGMDGPVAMRPWDTLDTAIRAGGYYGLEGRNGDPIRSAPSTLGHGGTVYFDRTDPKEGLMGAMQLLGMWHDWTKYAVFTQRSENTIEDRYLDQIRIVGFGALSQLYRIPEAEIAALPEQKLSVKDAVLAFLTWQVEEWGDPRWTFSPKISGSLGGDGDWAKESLAFGMTVENGYWQVYRVWSRPWLVTK